MTYYTKYSVGQIVKDPNGDERRIRGLEFRCMGTNMPAVVYFLDGYPDEKRFVEHELDAKVYKRVNPLNAFAC